MKLFLRSLSLALALAFSLQGQTRAQTSGMSEVPIVDPVLQMPAYMLAAPADWRVVGTAIPPASCTTGTDIVYKATSPDGSAGRYRVPSTFWAWGAGINAKGDCDLAQRVVSADDFLTYYLRRNKLGYVKAVAIPDSLRVYPQHPGQTIDQAAVLVRYSVDKTPMEGLISDAVVCTEFTSMGVGEYHVCSAGLLRAYAPLDRFDALLPTFWAMKLTVNQPWMTAWTNAMVTRVSSLYASQTRELLRQGAIAGAQRMQAHRDYMASMQQGADRRDVEFQNGQYQKQNNNDNYVDFVLDCSRSYSSDGSTRVSDADCPNRQTF